jgi:hypothetical protein
MGWVDPRELSDEELAAEIKSLEPKVVTSKFYFRRRWELIQEKGARQRQAEHKAKLAQIAKTKAGE